MKRMTSPIRCGLLITVLIAAGARAAIDKYDSAVVRAILDKIGWTDLPVDSVVPAGTAVSISDSQPTRVTTLNLACRNRLKPITELPSEISQLPELVSLSLKGNALTGLPDTVSTLHKLGRLDLSSNQLAQLPEALEGLPLQVLAVNHNPLHSLPDWIAALSTLQSASFVGDSLSTLPVALAKLSGLTTLNLDSNRLAALPGELTTLTSLKISVNGNLLCSIDTAIARWLDRAQLGIDWRASQRCDARITFTVTDAATGTVVHVAAEEKISADCRPVQLTAKAVSSFDWFDRRLILKAIEVRFNDCFTAAGNYFLVSFSWHDLEGAVAAGSDLAIYHVKEATSEYLGGTVDGVNKTVSIKATREGIYLLTIKLTTAADRTASPSGSAARPVRLVMHRDFPEASFTLERPSVARLQLFTLEGKLIAESAAWAGAGAAVLRCTGTAPRSTGRMIARLRTDEFLVTRILQYF